MKQFPGLGHNSVGRIDSITADLEKLAQSARPLMSHDIMPPSQYEKDTLNTHGQRSPGNDAQGAQEEMQAPRSPYEDLDSPSTWGDRSRQLLFQEQQAHMISADQAAINEHHFHAHAAQQQAMMEMPYYRWVGNYHSILKAQFFFSAPSHLSFPTSQPNSDRRRSASFQSTVRIPSFPLSNLLSSTLESDPTLISGLNQEWRTPFHAERFLRQISI